MLFLHPRPPKPGKSPDGAASLLKRQKPACLTDSGLAISDKLRSDLNKKTRHRRVLRLSRAVDYFDPPYTCMRLNSLDVRRLLALGTINDVKAYTLPFFQGLEALHVDSRKMGEQIFTTFIRGNKAEAFSVVEPFDDTSCHFTSLHKQAGEAEQQKPNVCLMQND